MTETIVNFFHLLAAAVWIGGMLFIFLVLQPSLRALDAQQTGRLMSVVVRRFAVASWVSILLLAITGYIKTPERMMFDFSYGLGAVLAIKHALVILAIVVGLILAARVLPALARNTPKPGEAPSGAFLRTQKQLGILGRLNAVLGLLILVCASQLW